MVTQARLEGYVEPMVHWGRELLSEAGYFHSVSMLDDPLHLKRACEHFGVKLSGLSAHTPIVHIAVKLQSRWILPTIALASASESRR